MPEQLEQGLYIASLGMGIVFLSLVVFLVIVLLLGKLFEENDLPTVDNTMQRGEMRRLSYKWLFQ